MSSMSRVRYKLPWPGLGSIPLFVIDKSDVVYGADNKVPPSIRHLNTPAHQYVKLCDILALMEDTADKIKANGMLTQLITEYGLRSMKTIACFKATSFGQQVMVDQYLPLMTLLALLVIFPCKAFDRFQNSLMEFLENNKEMTCLSCGFIRRNCSCKAGPRYEEGTVETAALGYGMEYSDKSMQTEDSIPRPAPSKTPPPAPPKPVEEKEQTLTGPGGMKIVLPPGTKLDQGAQLPLAMSSGPNGPCLVPQTTIPNIPMLPPIVTQQTIPPYSLDPSILMPPPPPPPPYLPPPYTPHMQSLLPPTPGYPNNPVGSFIPPGRGYLQPVKCKGPAMGHVDVRLPAGCNPKYINTAVGSYRKVVALRNVAIQVDTVVLPKKKVKHDATVTRIFNGPKHVKPGFALGAKKIRNILGPFKSKKDNVMQSVVDEESGNGEGGSKKDVVRISDLDEETAKIMDEETFEMLKRMDRMDKMMDKFKVAPVKKADKVWRMIEDDDSDDEEKIPKAGSSEDKKDGEAETSEKTETESSSPRKVGDGEDSQEQPVNNQETVEGEEATKSDETIKSDQSPMTTQTEQNSTPDDDCQEPPKPETEQVAEKLLNGSASETDISDRDKDKDSVPPLSSSEGSPNHVPKQLDDESPALNLDAEVAEIMKKSKSEDNLPSTENEISKPKQELGGGDAQTMNADKSTNSTGSPSVPTDVSTPTDAPNVSADAPSESTLKPDVSADVPTAAEVTTNGDERMDTDDVPTRPSSATEEMEEDEQMKRSMAAEVLGSLARLMNPGADSSTTEERKVDQKVEEGDSPQENKETARPEIDEENKLVIDISKEGEKPAASQSEDKVPAETPDPKPVCSFDDSSPSFGDLLPGSPTPGEGTPNTQGLKKYFAKFEHLPTGEKLYRCTFPTCSQCFDTRVAAKLHNQTHTVEDTVRRLLCSQCDYRVPFFKWFDLLRHLRETHNTGLTEDSNGCLFCGLVFETQELLTRHMEFHYSSRYKCVHCGLMMMSWGQVKLHMDNCPEKEQTKVNFGCPYCMFVFHKRTIRNLHMLSHSDQGLSCALCEDRSAQWEHWKMLRKHYQTRHAKALMTKIGPFRDKLPQKKRNPKCLVCGNEFKGQDLFNDHMIKVHDYVPYTLFGCKMCDRAFRTRRKHDWHVKNTHEEEASCDQCDFVGKNKTILRMHMTQKHCDKQHLCTECGKSFVYFHQLKVHMAHHARRIVHACRTCSQEFTRSAELRKHVLEEHSDPGERKVHNCTDCSYWTYTRSTLLIHVQKKHSGLVAGDDDLDVEDGEGSDHRPAGGPGGSGTSGEGLTMYDHSPPPYPRVTRPPTSGPAGSSGDGPNSRKKQKKRKRLTMPARRQSVGRASKTSEATVISPTSGRRDPVRDRQERKRLREEEEEVKKVKRLRRTSCARTRSLDEQKALEEEVEMENHEGMTIAAGGSLSAAMMFGKKAAGRSASVSHDVVPLTYPYLDHSYYRLDVLAPEYAASRTVQSKRRSSSTSLDYSRSDSMDIVSTPSVSEFEECETSPRKRSYNTSRANKLATRPGSSSEDGLPLSSTQQSSASSKLQSPVHIRSILSRALQASPTKNRSKVSQISQHLKSLGSDPPPLEMKDLDLAELINEAGEILPEQDLITDILNSIDTFNNLPGSAASTSTNSPKFTDGSFGSSPEKTATADLLKHSTVPVQLFHDGDDEQMEVAATEAASSSSMDRIQAPRKPKKTQEAASSSVDSSFDDALLEVAPVINEVPTDLDEIELKEADYQLWHDSPQPEVVTEEPLTEFSSSLKGAQIILEFKDGEDAEKNDASATSSATSEQSISTEVAPEEKGSGTKTSEGRTWLVDHQYY